MELIKYKQESKKKFWFYELIKLMILPTTLLYRYLYISFFYLFQYFPPFSIRYSLPSIPVPSPVFDAFLSPPVLFLLLSQSIMISSYLPYLSLSSQQSNSTQFENYTINSKCWLGKLDRSIPRSMMLFYLHLYIFIFVVVFHATLSFSIHSHFFLPLSVPSSFTNNPTQYN